MTPCLPLDWEHFKEDFIIIQALTILGSQGLLISVSDLETCYGASVCLLSIPMISGKHIVAAGAIFVLAIAKLTAYGAEPDTSTASGLLDSSYSAMVQADLNRDGGDPQKALLGYRTALSGFIKASQRHPELDPEVVRFRMAYCDNQIESLMKDMGMNGDAKPETPESREAMSSAPVQTAGATADALGIQLRAVRDQIAKRDLTAARTSLIGMLKQNPDDSEVRILMATVQCMLGRFDDAENIVATLIEEQPKLSRAHAVLSTAKIGLGDIDGARKALADAIKLGSSSSEVYYNMTQVILATKPLDVDAARESYRRSLQLGGRLDPDLEYLLK